MTYTGLKQPCEVLRIFKTQFISNLAKEVMPLGIYVTSVKPGGFRTDWGSASMSYAEHVAGYDSAVDGMIDYIKNHYVPVGDPEEAAKVMVDLANHILPPVHLVLGSESVDMIAYFSKSFAETPSL